MQWIIYRVLAAWENGWLECLDCMERVTSTNVGALSSEVFTIWLNNCWTDKETRTPLQIKDILEKAKSRNPIFDAPFERSRVCFQELEILRIFRDGIRETGRDLQELNPTLLKY